MFLIERRNELADPANQISLNPDEDFKQTVQKEVNFKLPPIGKASYIKADDVQEESPSKGNLKVNKVQKAQFISYSPSSALLN